MPETGEKSSAPLSYRTAPRPKPSLARRVVASGRSWARHTLSREALISSFKTFLWVVPLTVMIWIYAEREQLATYPNVPIKIEPQNNDPDHRVVTFTDASGRTLTISADLMGPHGRLEQVQRQLETSMALRLDFDARLDNGIHRIPTRLLGDDQLFKDNGITVRNIVPDEVTIKIDPVETRELPVQPPADNRLVSFTSDPRTVKVSAPQSFFRDRPNLSVRADVTLLDKPGPHEEKVNLAPSFTGRFVAVTPSTAAVKYDVRQADVRYKILAMPVWAAVPPTQEWDKYKAEYQIAVANVWVIGPEEKINLLKNEQATSHAEFYLVEAKPDFNLPDRPSDVPLHYVLPEGVRLDETAPHPKTISVKFKLRTPE
jgi:hypothetical protein